MATAAAAAVVTAVSSCSKRESDIARADLLKKAKKGRSPPEEEVEAFFAAVESDVARRFAAKYNYDVVKDAPMDGRYEWVRASQGNTATASQNVRSTDRACPF